MTMSVYVTVCHCLYHCLCHCICHCGIFYIAATLTIFEIYKGGLAYDNDTSHVGCDDGGVYTQCRDGQPRCFNRGSTCIYDTVRVDEGAVLDVQATCRDGAHLRNLCGETLYKKYPKHSLPRNHHLQFSN